MKILSGFAYDFIYQYHLILNCKGGAVAQSVERVTSGEVPGSIPAVAARSLLVGSVSV